MRVALFAAGGEIPVEALRALVAVATVVAVVRPDPPRGIGGELRGLARRALRRPRPPDGLSVLATEYGIPEWPMRGADDARSAARLRASAIDLGVLATFPWPLPPALLEAPRLGCVNMHPSILPRHRGPNPWFWTYHANDAHAGVTIHVCESRVDRGPILAQARWPLARGHPVASLHREVAVLGAALLPALLARAESMVTDAALQDESGATLAPRVRAGVTMLDPAWPAERTWHFLAGLLGQHREPLWCDGRAVGYTRVPEFELVDPRAAPGRMEAVANLGWRLWCHDGFVRLAED